MGYFLPFYPPNSPKNQNFKKMKKNILEIAHVYQKLWLDDVWFPRNGVHQKDRWMNRKSETQRWATPPKKLLSLTMTIIIIKTYQINTVHWKIETKSRWKKFRTIKDKLKYSCKNLGQSRAIQDSFENPGHSRTFQSSGHHDKFAISLQYRKK